MRILKALVAVLIISIFVIGAVGCNARAGATPTPTIRNVAAALGTVSNNVTGTASLALAKTQDLAFEAAGTVDSVDVVLYQSVTKGQQLVKLDPSVWDTQIENLTKSLTTAQRNLITKESAVTKAQRTVASAEFTKRQRELDLTTAQTNLNDIADVKKAQDAVDKAQQGVDFAEFNRQAALKGDGSDITFWDNELAFRKAALANANLNLKSIKAGTSTTITAATELQLTKAQFQVEQAQNAVSDTDNTIADANTAVSNAQLDVADAKAAITDIQKQINDIKNLNPIITAPFDGFITSLKVTGGDVIQKGKVAMQIADPNQFQAKFMVSETDIFSISVGQPAKVAVDAVSGQIFPAKITAIAPLATTNQGVVNYEVTAELTSLVPVTGGGGTRTFVAGGSLPGGTLPTTFPTNLPRQSGIPTATLSPEELQKIRDRFAAGQASRTANAPTDAKPVTLKAGLTASVTITIQEKANVLVVPNRAITKQAGNSTVQVVKGTVVETRTVKTGLSDSTNTEITDGLTEGETVQVKAAASASSNVFGGPGGGAVFRQ